MFFIQANNFYNYGLNDNYPDGSIFRSYNSPRYKKYTSPKFRLKSEILDVMICDYLNSI